MDIENFTDTGRRHPCISDGCDAYKRAGPMGGRRDGSRPVRKHAYGVRFHNMD